MFKLDLKQW